MRNAKQVEQGLSSHGRAWACTDACAEQLHGAWQEMLGGRGEDWFACRDWLDLYGCRREALAYYKRYVDRVGAVTYETFTQALCEVVTRHRHRFAPSSQGKPHDGWWGVWRGDGTVDVMARVVDRYARAWGLGTRRAKERLVAEGLLERGTDGRKTSTRRLDGKASRMYRLRLPLPVVEEKNWVAQNADDVGGGGHGSTLEEEIIDAPGTHTGNDVCAPARRTGCRD